MCFSATASFTSAALLGTIGLLTLKQVRHRPLIPFALIPLIFAFQQSMEGIVWLTYDQADLSWLKNLSIYVFLSIANIFWPVWCPFTVYQIEKNKKRKKLILLIGAIGAIIALIAIYWLIVFKAETQVSCNHISYQSISNFFDRTDPEYLSKLVILFGYTTATIVPFFISTVPRMWSFGLAVAIGWIAAQIFYTYSFGSIWCFFAAISSSLVYWITKGR